MEQFFAKNKTFVLSLVFMTAGITLFGWSNFVTTSRLATEDARLISSTLAADEARLNSQLEEIERRKAEAGQSASAGITSLPAFLERINEIAQTTRVIIDELMPSKDEQLKFSIKIRADYFTYLRFAAKLESLNVSIHDLQVRPFDPRVTPPIHAIEFSITPRNDAAPLGGERLARMRDQVEEKNKRNPFQRFAFNEANKEVLKQIELTWIHKLTGIGMSGGKRTATINGKDYAVDDELDGMKVTAIETDRLVLKKTTPDGVTEYLLKRRVNGVAAKSSAGQ